MEGEGRERGIDGEEKGSRERGDNQLGTTLRLGKKRWER